MNAKTSFWSCLSLAVCLASIPAFAASDDSSVKVKWSYVGSTGPTHWGMLNPAFELCDTGKSQAPINLGRQRVRAPYDLKMDYRPSTLAIGDEIPEALEIGDSQVTINNGRGPQINFKDKNTKETLTLAGKEYSLQEMHFHSPSETLWHKQSFPLEIHLVHQGKHGQAAILSIFVKGGAENPTLKVILDNLPKETHKVIEVPHVMINPMDLLPDDKRYYSYQGSLTTPPCTEGLQWISFSRPITASPAQILQIRQALGGTNARPVQQLNNQKLYYSVE